MLQCVVVGCSVSGGLVQVYTSSVLQCVEVCCSVLQCVAVFYSVSAGFVLMSTSSILQCVAVC